MIFVFLPAYNEEVALERVIRKLDLFLQEEKVPYHIVVVDDGSIDNTAGSAEHLQGQYPITLLRHPKNLGLGQTVIDGFKYIAEHSAPDDFIVSLDCDDTHEPKYLREAFHKIKEGYDLIILSRFQNGAAEEGLSWTRKFLSRGACLFLKFFFPIPEVYDYSCGFRVFRASLIQSAFRIFGDQFIRLPHLGFVVASELLIKCHMIGARMAEVPFTLHYHQKPGKSKNNTLKTIAGYFALVRLYWKRKSLVHIPS